MKPQQVFEDIIEDLQSYESETPTDNVTDHLLDYLRRRFKRRVAKSKASKNDLLGLYDYLMDGVTDAPAESQGWFLRCASWAKESACK